MDSLIGIAVIVELELGDRGWWHYWVVVPLPHYRGPVGDLPLLPLLNCHCCWVLFHSPEFVRRTIAHCVFDCRYPIFLNRWYPLRYLVPLLVLVRYRWYSTLVLLMPLRLR